MTKEEVTKLIKKIAVLYSPKIYFQEGEASSQVEAWHEYLKNEDAKAVNLALEYHTYTSPKVPLISDIMECLIIVTGRSLISPIAAWKNVKDFMDLYTSNPPSNLEDYLPSIVVKTVRWIGYDDLYSLRKSSDKFTGMDRKTFLEAYKEIYDKEMIQMKLPDSLKTNISNFQKSLPSYRQSKKDEIQKVKLLQRTKQQKEYEEENSLYQKFAYLLEDPEALID